MPAVLSLCASLLGLVGELTVSTSCSLLHVPLDLGAETSLAPAVAGRLAFARQKVDEVVMLGRWLHGDRVILDPAPRATARHERRGQGAAGRARGRARADPLRDPPGGAGLRAAGPADHHDRVVPADGRDPRGPGGAASRAHHRRRLRGRHAGRNRPGHRAAGRDRPGRAGARRARAQRHGAVLRRAARRVRRHRPRLGPVVREPVRPPADPARRRQPPPADDRRLGQLRPVAHEQAGQGHADRAGDDALVVVRPRRPATGARPRARSRWRSGTRSPTSRRPGSASSRSTSGPAGADAAAAGRPRRLPGLGGRGVPAGHRPGRPTPPRSTPTCATASSARSSTRSRASTPT